MGSVEKIKNTRAPGPDEIPIEFLKGLSDVEREPLRELINEWWTTEKIPEDQLKARVVLILKKGDSSTWGNFRPISLLNSTYKIIAALIRKRLSDTIDPFLQKTQYGFREKKSTAQAIHIIRGIMDTSVRSGIGINVVLLEWEKVFDKVAHQGLHDALERMDILAKFRNRFKE